MSKLLNSPIDSKNAGLRNESLVLNILRSHGTLSQSQLCRQAGISSSTACYIIARLREKGFIIEQQGQSTTRGAKPVIVRINPRGRLVIGVEVNPTDLFVALFDFNCELIESVRVQTGDERNPESIIKLLEINIRGLLAKHSVEESMLAGIGCTMSGSISDDGVVELSSPIGWKSVPLRSMLQTRFSCPIHIYPTRVRLLAETSIEPKVNLNNILYINVGNGVGSQAIVDGHLVYGGTKRSGEIGHIIIDPQGPVCGCGHKGCLETLISGPAIAKRIHAEIGDSDSILKTMVLPGDTPKEVICKWGQALEASDAYAISIRDYVCSHLARVAAIAINFYDPETIMLAGYVCQQCMDHLTDKIREHIATDVFNNDARNISIIPARAGELAMVLGAATAVFQNWAQANL